MLDNNNHADSVGLVGVVYVVDGGFGTATGYLNYLGSGGG